MEGRGEGEVNAGYRVASGGLFATMGIPLLRGRFFEERGGPATGDVAIAWLARYLPARRTTRVDPMITMRAE